MKMARQSKSSRQHKDYTNNRFKQLRLDEKSWTMEELARRAGVSSQTARKAERGLPVSEVSQARLAKALGVAVESLFKATAE